MMMDSILTHLMASLGALCVILMLNHLIMNFKLRAMQSVARSKEMGGNISLSVDRVAGAY